MQKGERLCDLPPMEVSSSADVCTSVTSMTMLLLRGDLSWPRLKWSGLPSPSPPLLVADEGSAVGSEESCRVAGSPWESSPLLLLLGELDSGMVDKRSGKAENSGSLCLMVGAKRTKSFFISIKHKVWSHYGNNLLCSRNYSIFTGNEGQFQAHICHFIEGYFCFCFQTMYVSSRLK